MHLLGPGWDESLIFWVGLLLFYGTRKKCGGLRLSRGYLPVEWSDGGRAEASVYPYIMMCLWRATRESILDTDSRRAIFVIAHCPNQPPDVVDSMAR